jgi:hypothetical protein
MAREREEEKEGADLNVEEETQSALRLNEYMGIEWRAYWRGDEGIGSTGERGRGGKGERDESGR